MTTQNANPSASQPNDTSLPRRAARELAFQFLFGYFPDGITERQDAVEPASRIDFTAFCENFGSEVDDFAWSLVFGTSQNLIAMDEQIRSLSRNWRLERMPRVDLMILRIAAFEILHREDIPKSVSINEAVELAKKFGAEGSASFINGILDKFTKST